MVFKTQVGMKLGLALVFIILQHFLSFSQAQTDNQVKALIAIKETVGEKSTKLISWSTTSRGPCLDKWYGVTCDDSSKIIGLNMSSCSLQGTLSFDAFSELTSLISLDFSQNSLESPLPNFSQLKSLHDLNFSTNILSGPFPTSILSLTNLVELRLHSNNYMGILPEQISNLQLLEALWLGNLTLSGPLPKGLASLTHLQILTVWGSNLNMELPPEWGRWTNITYLNLHNAGLKGKLPSEWGQNFTRLQRLWLYNNELTGDIPESWKGMKSLNDLRLKNDQISGNVPSWISQLVSKNATVEFSCNYLTGPRPTISFQDSTWQGNCFDNDMRAHKKECPSEPTCQQFLNGGVASSKKKVPVGAIVGGVIGAIVVTGAILGLFCWARPAQSNILGFKRADYYNRCKHLGENRVKFGPSL